MSQRLLVAALFTSACLVFTVQPMVAQYLLPVLGGTAVVWSVCLVFFQAVLLGGYLYAHVLSTRLTLRYQLIVHGVLLLGGLAFVPPIPASPVATPDHPVTWLLLALMRGVALPFFALSATAPLFQSWYARTRDSGANDPYPLYAASNAGSMLALLSYPLVLEPTLPLDDLSWAWAGVFVAFIGLTALTARKIWREASREGGRLEPFEPERPPTLREGAIWTGLGFVPSAMLVSVTTYLTTDMAAIPLLWIVPLALYLLSFILAFGRRQWLPHAWVVTALPVLLVVTLLTELLDTLGGGLGVGIALNLTTFFVASLALHQSLVRRRPEARAATHFYLAMSLGGVLGGIASALLAPAVFDTVLEHPLLLIVAAWAMPGPRAHASVRWRWKMLLVGGALSILFYDWASFTEPPVTIAFAGAAVLLVLGLVLVWAYIRPWSFRIGFSIIAGLIMLLVADDSLVKARSYFASYRVASLDDARVLFHGTTIHGAQGRGARNPNEPLMYYGRATGIGQFFATLEAEGRPAASVGVVGLGVGALAAYGHEDMRFDFFEIDPLMERLARDHFTFLEACGPRCRVILGDGRLCLAQIADDSYDLLVLDAYSSDSIPVHLLTREAMRIYRRVVRPGGVLAFHVSNNHMALTPVVVALANDADLLHLHYGNRASGEGISPDAADSEWIFLVDDLSALGALPTHQNASYLPESTASVWTDGHADVIGVLRW